MRHEKKTVSERIAAEKLEKDVEEEVLTILQALGCRVLKNTVHIASNNPRHHRTGQSFGVPDLSVRKDKWPRGFWLGLELKRPVGWKYSCPEQEELHRVNAIVVIHSAEEAITEIKNADALFAKMG